MPIRDLLYIAREYEKVIPARSRYKTGLIKIPTPRFLVFYNGVRDQPLEQTLRLSDAFMEKEDEISLELVVRVININSDKHHELLEKCRVLKEYSLFVETARKYRKEKAPLTKAIKECIEKDILADYLLKKSNEVINMLMAEYDYETDIEMCIRDRDHTGLFFEGLENYAKTSGIRTFSRGELLQLLERAGDFSVEFYYPYPDYKFPMTIYSDSYLPKKGELKGNFCNYDRPRAQFFDEARVYDSLAESGMFRELSNSFLVLAKKEAAK